VLEANKDSLAAAAERPKLLLDVHLNEYQALTTRATYYVVMSTAIWPLIFLYLGLLATAWQHLLAPDSDKFGFPLMVWGGGLGVQLALVIWTFLVCEQYKMTLYVERDLRPFVQDIVGTSSFWLYERKLRGRTPLVKWLELQTELWVFVFIMAAVLLRVLIFHKFTPSDWIGLALNLVVLVVLVLMAVSAAKTRHKWELGSSSSPDQTEMPAQTAAN
jgi:hypothetical protein